MKKSHVLGAVFLIISIAFIWLHISWTTSGEDVYLGSEEMNVEMSGWRLSVDGQDKGMISLPADIQAEKNAVISLEKQITGTYKEEPFLCFWSSESLVWVYVDDRLAYSYGAGRSYALSQSPGSIWNMVALDEGSGTYAVRIILVSPYQGYSGNLSPVYMGTRIGISTQLIKQNVPVCFIGFLCILIAFAGLGSYLLIRNSNIKSSLYFSLLTFLAGVQLLTESKIEQFVVRKPFLVSQLAHILSVIFPIVLLLYILAIEEYKESRYFKWLFCFTCFGTIGITATVFLRIFDFIQLIPLVTIMWFLILLGCIRNQVARFWVEKGKRDVKWRDLALLVLLVTGLHDMIRLHCFYEVAHKRWFPLGIIIFTILLVAGYEREFQKLYFSKIKDKRFKVLAYTDALTGLRNRASFEEKIDQLRVGKVKPADECIIIMIDINYLKEINDNLGHKYGDRAIISVAKAIQSCFSKYGWSYRIGGDEFCVILNKKTEKKVHYMLDALTEEIAHIHLTDEFSLSIASGYERFTPEMHETVDDVLVKADKRMYLCKRHMKSMEKLS